jgi:hypothetical protein
METSTKTSRRITAQQTYVEKELNSLIGGKIIAIAAVIDNSDEEWPEVWPVLNLLLPNGKTLEVSVSSDEEGNGPGHLFIDEVTA